MVLVELTDFVFAMDSILAGIALIGLYFTPSHFPPKIWIVYFGGIIGMVFMRFTINIFIKLIDRFPNLETGSQLIVGLMGIKLLIEATLRITQTNEKGTPIWLDISFWFSLVVLFILSFFVKKRRHPKNEN